MGYDDAVKDGVRTVGGLGKTTLYYPLCKWCGEEVKNFSYLPNYSYSCPKCKYLHALDDCYTTAANEREKTGKRLTTAIERLRKVRDIVTYVPAIEKVIKEIAEGVKYESTEEVMTALELSRRRVHYRPQVKMGSYRVDFVLDDEKVVLEVDGRAFHTKATQAKEELRDNLIVTALGAEWEVLRITDDLINENATKICAAIYQLKKRRKKVRETYGELPAWYNSRRV